MVSPPHQKLLNLVPVEAVFSADSRDDASLDCLHSVSVEEVF